MAVKVMTPKSTGVNSITEFVFEAATTASDGLKFTVPQSDERVMILIANVSTTTAYDITIKKPTTGGYAAADADEKVELGAGEFAVIKIETAKFANNDGTVLLIPEHADVKAVVLY